MMDTANDTITERKIHLDVELVNTVNYAFHQNGRSIIRSLTICNDTDQELFDIDIMIRSSVGIFSPFKRRVNVVPPKTSFRVGAIDLIMDAESLAGITEKIKSAIEISCVHEGEVLCSSVQEFTTLAFDEWQGSLYYPELLTAFILPNHPEIAKIISSAAHYLEKWTGRPSLDAYQSQDTNRVLMQAAAVYAALQEQNIVYAVPPASFEDVGQRIRLCDTVIQQKMGTCIDLTLLYSACLEAIGLNPILVVFPNHIFAGVWLEDKTFPETVQSDVSLITKRLAEGINEVMVVECTAFTAGKQNDFDGARQNAEKQLSGEKPVEYIIDVKRSRLSGITPLPIRIQTDEGWHVERDPVIEIGQEGSPKPVMGALDIDSSTDGGIDPVALKKMQWERKLLDLGLRNTLINMRLSRNIVPILTASLDNMEDKLADGKDFSIEARPADWETPVSQLNFETMHEVGNMRQVIESEFDNKRLRSSLGENELQKTMKFLYRASKSSIEENGANTLYLALGLIKWFETDKSMKERYAPIILLPIEMVRKSGGQNYVIRLRDEEPQMNITILEKLKQDFDITISGLDPLPQDEHGIDTRLVYTIIRKAIMKKSRWDVLESAYLGIFSFSQFVMWNDLQNRIEDLLKNKVVRSLMEGKLVWDAEEMVLPGQVDEEDVYLPIPADASQLYAIKEAGNGQSFVLHGPPGTGKSQTITAIIANALAQKKTVLFIAEKMAALEVVQKRLDAIGIGPFCLELHSNKSKKKDVLEQLRVASEVVKEIEPEEYKIKAEQISQTRKEIQSYADEIHKRHSCGYSIFELINIYSENRKSKGLSLESTEELLCSDRVFLDENEAIIGRLVSAGRAIGHPNNHALERLGLCEYSQQIRFSIDTQFEKYKSVLEILKKSHEDFYYQIGVPSAPPFSQLEHHIAISRELMKWYSFPAAWSKKERLGEYTIEVMRYADENIRLLDLRKNIEARWLPEFLTLNGEELSKEISQIQGKWFLAKMSGMKNFEKRLAPYHRGAMTRQEMLLGINNLFTYQSEARRLFALDYRTDLGSLYQRELTDWNGIKALADSVKKCEETIIRVNGSNKIRIYYGGDPKLKPFLEKLLQTYSDFLKEKEVTYRLFKISETPVSDSWLNDEIEMCSSVIEAKDKLKEWIAWKNICQEAENHGLRFVIDGYIGGIPHDEIKSAYLKTVSKLLAIHLIDRSATLNQFAGTLFDNKIHSFIKLNKELSDLSKKEIYCILGSLIPNFAREATQSSEVGVLQRAIKSGGRGLSIRKLFEQIPHLLPRLCPCMLMSPLSAAQYLDPKREPFDLVVFDEASQLTTSKAVGALARGKNAVIVGDPKQMPPTSFFASRALDEDNIEYEDLESVLDDCLALSMPETHLLWHYRSRHESLIAFSNRMFYENRLFTFPSVNDRDSKVSLKNVNGVFDRGKSKTNKEEASAVVDEIKRRCHDPELSRKSLGVVTFNISQQNLIDDMLSQVCLVDSELEEWAYNSDEPLFIKNLENVQGDERDVILFSIGYGPDENGKIYMNFGPLNREGGWRRLNVAVSRARYEMMVFSSLTADQINLRQTTAEGVAALKNFIEYAGGKVMDTDEVSIITGNRERKHGIIREISQALNEHGYRTDTFVGKSAYQVDIGVLDKDDPDRYMLGILLDGRNYGEAKTVYDREIGQISVLKGLGWNIARVWSMDWWDNYEKEIDKILNILKTCEKGGSIPDSQPVKPDNIQFIAKSPDIGSSASKMNIAGNTAIITNTSPYRISEYKAADIAPFYIDAENIFDIGYRSTVRDVLTIIINQEAPISKSLLIRRTLESFGISRAGSRIQEYMSNLIYEAGNKLTRQNGRDIVWAQGQDPDNYNGIRSSGDDRNKRDAKDVPIQEAVNSLLYILYEEVSLNIDDLKKEGAKLLGYSRSGRMVSELMDEAVKYAENHDRIAIDPNGNATLDEMLLS